VVRSASEALIDRDSPSMTLTSCLLSHADRTPGWLASSSRAQLAMWCATTLALGPRHLRLPLPDFLSYLISLNQDELRLLGLPREHSG
jgi:hypothetical protein